MSPVDPTFCLPLLNRHWSLQRVPDIGTTIVRFFHQMTFERTFYPSNKKPELFAGIVPAVLGIRGFFNSLNMVHSLETL